MCSSAIFVWRKGELADVHCERESVPGEKPDAVILAASYNDTRLPVTLTKFRTMSEARNTLLDLANALGGGQTVYHLQDYLADGSMTWKRDARVKRRGGS